MPQPDPPRTTRRNLESARRVLRSRDLRRLEVAFMGFAFSEHASWLAILVYASLRGGAREVGIVAVAQLLPAVFLAPLAAYAGDRFRPQRALAGGYLAQSASMALTAWAMWRGDWLLAYLASGVASTCITFTRPVMGSLLPAVTHAPTELIAANIVTAFLERVGVFAGPLVAGALMVVSTPASVFAITALATGAAAVLVVTVDPVERAAPARALRARQVFRQAFAGFAVLRRTPLLRSLVWLAVTAGIVRGIADVVFVTFPVARLGGSAGQSGLLAAAYGLGALVGTLGITRLARNPAATGHFLVGGMLCALPLLGLAGIGVLAPALLAFALVGAGEVLVHLTSFVTVQRRAPLDVMTRIFGISEGLRLGAVALGSLAVSLLESWSSLSAALVVLAAAVMVSVLGGVVMLRRHAGDALPVDHAVVDRLLRDPVLAPLPAPVVERLARSATKVRIPASTVVVAEGDAGEHYYLVCAGNAEVTKAGKLLNSLGAGDAFGEIALLRDVPRTASVVARSELELLEVPRADFLEAVTGHPRSLRTVNGIVDGHLAR